MNSTLLLRNLSIVLGATILSVVGPNILQYFPKGSIRQVFLLLLAVTLILYGFGSIEKIIRYIQLKARRSHWFCPRVGILCGVSKQNNADIPLVWTDIAPEEWCDEIKVAAQAAGIKINAKLVYANESINSYNAIINPFGGNYPESSFDGFPVYNKLLKYIRQGGFFVNVADIPTYWAYNPNLKHILDRTPAVYGVAGEEVRFFNRAPLMEELALRIFNVEHNGPPEWPAQMTPEFNNFNLHINTILASRAVLVDGNVEPVIDPITDKGVAMTPLFFCNYGDGRCLFSLSFLNDAFISNRPLKSTISNLVINQISK